MSALDQQNDYDDRLIIFVCKDGKKIEYKIHSFETTSSFINNLIDISSDKISEIELSFCKEIIEAVLHYISTGIMFPPSTKFEDKMLLTDVLNYFCVDIMPDIHTEWDDNKCATTNCTFVGTNPRNSNYHIQESITNCGFDNIELIEVCTYGKNTIEKKFCEFRLCYFNIRYIENYYIDDYTNCVFINCTFKTSMVNFRRCKFVNCILIKIALHIFTECEFDRCYFNRCEYGTLSNSVFTNCDLKYFVQTRTGNKDEYSFLFCKYDFYNSTNVKFHRCDLSYSTLKFDSGSENNCILTNVTYLKTMFTLSSIKLYRTVKTLE